MEKIIATLLSEKITSNSKSAHDLFATQRFGEKMEEKILYFMSEALYLIQEGKMDLFDSKNKKMDKKEILKRFEKIDKKFKTKYLVFKDLRRNGYIVKPALKFGAEFRVYEKGKEIKDTHSKWICFPVSENQPMTWQDFSAKNRIAHSTKKNLLIAIVDDEGEVTYFEVKWIKA